MKSRTANISRFFFIGMDLFMLNSLHLVLVNQLQRISGNSYEYNLFFLISNMSWLFTAYANAVYAPDTLVYIEFFVKRSIKAFAFSIFIMLAFIFIYNFDYSRLFVILNFAGFGLGILITRLFFMLVVYFMRKGNKFGKRVIILGYNELSKRLVNYFVERNRNISIEGYFEDPQQVSELSNFPILGKREDCLSYAIENKITEIYSTLPPEENDYVYELAQVAEMNMIRFKLVPYLQLFVNRQVYIDFVADIPILSMRAEPLEEITARIQKRIFDIIISTLVITLLLSWLIPIIALLIKLNSKGPVFFIQVRSGKNNMPFRCLKFRTLKVNKEADSKQVTQNDVRMTKLGRFLRKSNFDELPQFLNVLYGNMSIVGPRPHMLKHTQDFSRLLNSYMIRHFVKPGVTGWAQVHGYRGEIKKDEQLRKRIEHDIWYLENWSLWLDLRIVFLTIWVTIRGDKNAY